jgi:hypothetical protein
MSRMHEAIAPLPNTPSWRGGQLKYRWDFYGEELLTLRPIPKLEDLPLSAVHDCGVYSPDMWSVMSLFFP